MELRDRTREKEEKSTFYRGFMPFNFVRRLIHWFFSDQQTKENNRFDEIFQVNLLVINIDLLTLQSFSKFHFSSFN